MFQFLFAAIAGAAAMFFLDPDQGRRRRAMTRDRSGAWLRRTEDLSQRVRRRVASDAYGVSQRMSHPRDEQEMPANDAILAGKVMTELFRDPRLPKGSINVNAADGIVQLRGEVDDPEMIRDIEERARVIPGVLDVESFLHLPGTPAPIR